MTINTRWAYSTDTPRFNPLSGFWNGHNVKQIKNAPTLAIMYLGGMIGYALELPIRVCFVVKELFKLAYVWCKYVHVRDFDYHPIAVRCQWTVCKGAFASVISGAVGAACPVLAYRLDKKIFATPLVRHSLGGLGRTIDAPLQTPEGEEINERVIKPYTREYRLAGHTMRSMLQDIADIHDPEMQEAFGELVFLYIFRQHGLELVNSGWDVDQIVARQFLAEMNVADQRLPDLEDLLIARILIREDGAHVEMPENLAPHLQALFDVDTSVSFKPQVHQVLEARAARVRDDDALPGLYANLKRYANGFVQADNERLFMMLEASGCA